VAVTVFIIRQSHSLVPTVEGDTFPLFNTSAIASPHRLKRFSWNTTCGDDQFQFYTTTFIS
ncbi:hypothetical protein L9F63_015060, partial [Diploptera punctata]